MCPGMLFRKGFVPQGTSSSVEMCATSDPCDRCTTAQQKRKPPENFSRNVARISIESKLSREWPENSKSASAERVPRKNGGALGWLRRRKMRYGCGPRAGPAKATEAHKTIATIRRRFI